MKIFKLHKNNTDNRKDYFYTTGYQPPMSTIKINFNEKIWQRIVLS